MADFPDNIFTQRTITNRVGQVYDPAKTTTIYAEDIEKLGDEITAIDTAFEGSGHYTDDDVTVTEFFGSAVNLGTGGYCRVDAILQWQFLYMRIEIVIGTSPSLGSLPLTIMADDLPITVPEYPAGKVMPGNFGALTESSNAVQMFAPALNNITGYGNCLLFFKEAGAAFTDYLLGVNSVATLGAGDAYNGSILIPLFDYGA